MLHLVAWLTTGHFLFRFLLRRPPSPGAALAFGMALWVPLGFIAMALSLSPLAPLAVELGAGILMGIALAMRRRPLGFGQASFAVEGGAPGRFVALVLMLAMVAGVVINGRYAGIPPGNFDVLSYHLPLASAVGVPSEGPRLLWAPQTFYERLPLGGPILESPFVSPGLGGNFGVALQLFLIVCLLASASCAARIVGWLGGRLLPRLLAAALVILHPMATGAVLQSLQEPIMGLFALAAVEMLLHGVARNGGGPRALVVAGTLAGSAVAVKLSAVGVTAIPLTVALIVMLLRGPAPLRIRLAAFVAWSIGGAVAAGLWLLRSFLHSGHPMHPFGGFSDAWTAEQARFVLEAHEPVSVLSAVYWSDFVAKLSNLGYPLGGIPLMLLGGALALASPAGRRGIPLILAVGLAYGAYLTVRINPARFLYPAAILLVPLAAHGIAGLRLPRRMVPMTATLALGLGLLAAGKEIREAFAFDAFYASHERRDALGVYIGQDLVPFGAMACDQAEEGRVLLFFESRPTLFPCAVESRTVWDQASYAADLKAATDDVDFARRLRARGIRAIFVNEPEWGRYLDFYAQKAMGPGERRFGRITIAGDVLPSEREAGLLNFPPHAAAGLGQREIAILEAFLRRLRQSTFFTSPAGRAEIWLARIPPTDRNGTSE